MADEPDRLFGEQVVAAMHARHLAHAIEAHRQITNRLWVGNGTGALAVGTGLSQGLGAFSAVSLGFFVAGLISLGIGAGMHLWGLSGHIHALEDAQSVLDIPAAMIRRPSEDAGLAFSDPRTWSGVVAAGCFVIGVGFGAVALWSRFAT